MFGKPQYIVYFGAALLFVAALVLIKLNQSNPPYVCHDPVRGGEIACPTPVQRHYSDEPLPWQG